MAKSYSQRDRDRYVDAMKNVGRKWLEAFADEPAFYSAQYWDLFTAMYRLKRPVKKEDAKKFITGAPKTAGNYIDGAIALGYVIERPDPADRRVKLLSVSRKLKRRLDAAFDAGLAELETLLANR